MGTDSTTSSGNKPTIIQGGTKSGLTIQVDEPAIAPPSAAVNVAEWVVRNAQDHPGDIAVRRHTDGQWQDITCAQFHDEVRAVAKGIAAAGVQVGDRVGILGRTCYEWTLADFALWYAGAVPVPIYDTSSPEQIEWILSDSGAVAVFCETADHRANYEEIADRVPNVVNCWVFEDGVMGDLTERGVSVGDDDIDRRRGEVTPADTATIIYTSGTTGKPKGCTLTHDNLNIEIDSVVSGLPALFYSGKSTLLFLPLAHVFGRVIELGCIRARVTIGHTNDPLNLLGDLAAFHPDFLLAVPRVFEKVYNSARQKADADGKGWIFDAAASTAIDYSRALDTGGPGLLLRLKHTLFDRLVYGKLREALGGQVTHAVSGGAALGERLGHFYRGIGLIVLEGYGLTETSAASTLNRPEATRIGSVGRPIPGTSVAIAEDGEILLRGGHIFAGYWNNPKATAEVMSADGWFHTGDIGRVDAEGFLSITGRKKELLVTAGGKNVAPAVLEDRLRAHPLVSQCMVVGDGKPFIAALVTLDAEALPAWLTSKGRPGDTPAADLTEDEQVLAAIQEAVDEANKAVSRAESIRKFRILPTDWTPVDGQLTPSLKLKRNVVMKEHAADVEALYS